MIEVLPSEVVQRIAAGEVVERPASVVKELIENALDAGARSINVELEAGGIDLVRVSDDGHGIPSAEVELAFQRHATSKIRSDADLHALATLGFRGEALPSIAAVACVRLSTRHSSEDLGVLVAIEYGRVVERQPSARVPGTSVAVLDLFQALPARRKFLKPRAAEGSAAVQVVCQYALAYPEVAFSLVSDGRRVIRTVGDGDRRAAVAAVYGSDLASDMLDLLPATAQDQGRIFAAVSGLVGRQTVHRANRSALSLFVNRRWVQHRLLAAMIEQAYQTLLPLGRHPVAVIDITIPPDEADFNVHPAKSEVKLLRERAVCGLVQRAIQDTLVQDVSVLGWQDDPLAHQQPHEPLGQVRVLGQVSGTYIIAEGVAGLYLVDQHAAHERVLLEDLRRSRGRDGAVQYLLEPVVVELDARQGASAAQHRDALAELGFLVEEFGPRSLLLRAVPAIAAGRDPSVLFRNSLDAADEDNGPSDWRERLALALSCHSAVRAGDVLAPEEMTSLLARLGEAELCRTCAHGRPTAILLTHTQLEREFGRR